MCALASRPRMSSSARTRSGPVISGQPGALLEPRRVAEVEGQLGRLGVCGDDRLRGLGLGRGASGDVQTGVGGQRGPGGQRRGSTRRRHWRVRGRWIVRPQRGHDPPRWSPIALSSRRWPVHGDRAPGRPRLTGRFGALTPDSQAGPAIPVSAATSDEAGSGVRGRGRPRSARRRRAHAEAGDAVVPVRTRFPATAVARDHRSSSATWSSRSRRVTRPRRPRPAEVNVVSGP